MNRSEIILRTEKIPEIIQWLKKEISTTNARDTVTIELYRKIIMAMEAAQATYDEVRLPLEALHPKSDIIKSSNTEVLLDLYWEEIHDKKIRVRCFLIPGKNNESRVVAEMADDDKWLLKPLWNMLSKEIGIWNSAH